MCRCVGLWVGKEAREARRVGGRAGRGAKYLGVMDIVTVTDLYTYLVHLVDPPNYRIIYV